MKMNSSKVVAKMRANSVASVSDSHMPSPLANFLSANSILTGFWQSCFYPAQIPSERVDNPDNPI